MIPFQRFLLAALLTTVYWAPSYAQTGAFCQPAPTTPYTDFQIEDLSPAEQQQWRIMAEGREIHSAFKNGQDSSQAVVSRLQDYRARVLQFLASHEDNKDKALARPLVQLYFAIAQEYISRAMAHEPRKLQSPNDYDELFQFPLSLDAVKAIFPTYSSIPTDLILIPDPMDSNQQIVRIDGLSVVNSMIRGLGNKWTDDPTEQETLYVEMSKCLISNIQASKLAFHQILRGATTLKYDDYATRPVCGQLTVKQLGDAYLEKHQRGSFESHHRNALSEASPYLQNYLTEEFKTRVRVQGQLENNAFFDVYLFGSSEVDPTYTSYVTQEMDRAIQRIEADFGPYQTLFSLPDVREQVFALLNDCDADIEVANRRDFIDRLNRTEKVYFFSMINSQYGTLPFRLKGFPQRDMAAVIEIAVKEARVLAATTALLTALAKFESDADLSDLQPMAAEFSEKILEPAAKSIASDTNLIATIARRYVAHERLGSPFTQLRETFFAQLSSGANEIAKYDNPNIDLAELPFRKSHMLDLYDEQLKALSPQARQFTDIILSEQDYETAVRLWHMTNGFFTEDLSELQIGLRAFSDGDWKSGLRNLFNTFWGALSSNPTTNENSTSNETTAANNVTATAAYQNPNSARTLGQRIAIIRGNKEEQLVRAFKNYREFANKAKDGAQIRADYRNLKFLAERLGYSGRGSEPQTVKDVILPMSQSISGEDITHSELRNKIDRYRELMKAELFAVYRLLEMPFQGDSFYKTLLAAKPPAQHLVDAAIMQLQRNIADHIKTMVNAKSIRDLYPYITRSYVLNMLFGEEDIDAFLMAKDVWPLAQALGALKGNSEDVFPRLLKYHYDIKSELLRAEDRTSRRWDEFLHTTSFAVNTLWLAWGAKAFFPFLPRLLGGSLIPGYLKLGARRTAHVIDAYWWAIIGYLGLETGLHAWRHHQTGNVLDELNHLSFAEGVRVETPLIDHVTYQMHTEFYEDRQNQEFWASVRTGGFFIAPFLANPALRYFYRTYMPARMARKQKLYDELMQNGRTAEAQALVRQIENKTARKFERLGKTNSVYFKWLNLPEGTWSVREIMSARQAILRSGDAKAIARAEEAYLELMQEIGKHLLPVSQTPILTESFVNGVWKNTDELILFEKEWERLVTAGVLR